MEKVPLEQLGFCYANSLYGEKLHNSDLLKEAENEIALAYSEGYKQAIKDIKEMFDNNLENKMKQIEDAIRENKKWLL